jgi:hypothetical protein
MSFTWDRLNSIELRQDIMDGHVIITGMSTAENRTFRKKVGPLTLQAVQLSILFSFTRERAITSSGRQMPRREQRGHLGLSTSGGGMAEQSAVCLFLHADRTGSA